MTKSYPVRPKCRFGVAGLDSGIIARMCVNVYNLIWKKIFKMFFIKWKVNFIVMRCDIKSSLS